MQIPVEVLIPLLIVGGFVGWLLYSYDKKKTFPKEYEFTCQRCGAKWYMTPAEVKESKKLEKDIQLLKARRIGAITASTHNAFTEKIAFVEHMKKSTKKCPQCGSCEITTTEKY